VPNTPLNPTRTTQATGRACGAVHTFHHGHVALEPATRGPLSQPSPLPFGRNSARLELSENPGSFGAYSRLMQENNKHERDLQKVLNAGEEKMKRGLRKDFMCGQEIRADLQGE
jgi:hypothetical protein